MNQKTSQAVAVYVDRVFDGGRIAEISRALPAHIRPERFQRNVHNLMLQNADLTECNPGDVFREVAKAAALGLVLDPQLGEAYLVTAWSKAGKVPQLRVGYRGLIKMARQSGEIANIYPSQVCRRDFFEVDEGTDRRIVHKPDYTKPRGEPVCYYAVVAYRDGAADFEVMSLEEIHAIRDRSDAWRAFQAGKIKSTPWSTDEGQMAKKTVLRRLLNRVPQSPDLAEAIGIENHADFAPEAPRLAPVREAVPIAAPAETPEHDADGVVIETEAVETIAEDQARALHQAMQALGKPDQRKFLAGLGVDRPSKIPAARLAEAQATLRAILPQPPADEVA